MASQTFNKHLKIESNIMIKGQQQRVQPKRGLLDKKKLTTEMNKERLYTSFLYSFNK